MIEIAKDQNRGMTAVPNCDKLVNAAVGKCRLHYSHGKLVVSPP